MFDNYFVCRTTRQNTLLFLADATPHDPNQPATQDVRRSSRLQWHAVAWHSDPKKALRFSRTSSQIIAQRVKRDCFVLNPKTDSSYSLEEELRFSLCRHWLAQGQFLSTMIMTEDGYYSVHNPRSGNWTNGDFTYTPRELKEEIEWGMSFYFWNLSDVNPQIYRDRPYLQTLINHYNLLAA